MPFFTQVPGTRIRHRFSTVLFCVCLCLQNLFPSCLFSVSYLPFPLLSFHYHSPSSLSFMSAQLTPLNRHQPLFSSPADRVSPSITAQDAGATGSYQQFGLPRSDGYAWTMSLSYVNTYAGYAGWDSVTIDLARHGPANFSINAAGLQSSQPGFGGWMGESSPSFLSTLLFLLRCTGHTEGGSEHNLTDADTSPLL